MAKGTEENFTENDRIVVAFLYACIVFFGIIGNGIILISLWCRNEARKKQCNIFIASLSLTDFITSAFCGPYYLRSLFVSDFITDEKIQYWFCKATLSIAYTLAIESIMSLTLISLDRFLAILAPFWYQRWVSRRCCITVACLFWLYSFIIVLPSVVMPGLIVYENNAGAPCAFEWAKADPVYITVCLSISFVLPAFVISITNTLVFKTAREQNRRIKMILPIEKNIDDESISNFKRKVCTHPFIKEEKEISQRLPQKISISMTSSAGNDVRREKEEIERKLILNVRPSQAELAEKTVNATNNSWRIINNKIDEINIENQEDNISFVLPSQQPNSENHIVELRAKNKKASNGDELPVKSKKKSLKKTKVKTAARTEMKLVLATISLSIAFLLSWMPFVLSRLFKIAGVSDVSERMINYSTVFGMISSAWNPCIILATKKEILYGFVNLLKSMRKKICFKKNSD